MNHDFLIRSTNRIARYALIALIYWLFIFALSTIFDLKIFKERLTETFLFSVLGIFALLGGAVVLNVMSNLSKISAAIAKQHEDQQTTWHWPTRNKLLLAVSFPVIALGLLAGDAMSAHRKKIRLIQAAEQLVEENRRELGMLTDYEFSPAYVARAANIIGTIQRIDRHLPNVKLLMPDQIEGRRVFLMFGQHWTESDSKKLERQQLIQPMTKDERDYLQAVFDNKHNLPRFEATGGNYQLYFPVKVNNKQMLLYFTDFQAYGKFGS
ncbi:hypothetical protein HNQ59_003528 [Chitinivorax tropicus]|uniref:Uncharacterized protein n=1 Tax=Chitinivorax tropicus TaxID=714531 RepID=A0A840MYI3_9PROT|nr:hypothetical protein [Chitinivorax tropicus]MBB5020211.1 hypothetical protein [Chitinivorax tropicus]